MLAVHFSEIYEILRIGFCPEASTPSVFPIWNHLDTYNRHLNPFWRSNEGEIW